jgi:MipA family protein
MPASGWKIGMEAGPVFGSADYHEYYYSVAPRFATADRPAYDAQSGFGGMQWTGSITRRREQLWVGAFVRAQSLQGSEIEDSPLVHTRSGVAAGIAFAWIFARSGETVTSAADD